MIASLMVDDYFSALNILSELPGGKNKKSMKIHQKLQEKKDIR